MTGEGSLFDVPPAAIGRFRVLHQLGAGTCGPVFRAVDPESDTTVAIKLFTIGLPPGRAGALAEALAELVVAGERAGLDGPAARAEGLALSAAVLESGGPSGAPAGWAKAVGRTVTDFFDNAPRGRRFASGASPLLAGLVGESSAGAKAYASALAEVAVAACTVDGAPVTAVGKATVCGQAQLAAAGVAAGPATALPPPAPDAVSSSPPSSVGNSTQQRPGGAGGAAHFPGGDPFDLSGLPNAGAVPGLDRAQLDARSVIGQLSALQEATREVLRRGFPSPFGGDPSGEATGPAAPHTVVFDERANGPAAPHTVVFDERANGPRSRPSASRPD